MHIYIYLNVLQLGLKDWDDRISTSASLESRCLTSFWCAPRVRRFFLRFTVNRNQSFFFFTHCGHRTQLQIRWAKNRRHFRQCGISRTHVSMFALRGCSARCVAARSVLAVSADDMNRVSFRLAALVRGWGWGWVVEGWGVESPPTNHHLDAWALIRTDLFQTIWHFLSGLWGRDITSVWSIEYDVVQEQPARYGEFLVPSLLVWSNFKNSDCQRVWTNVRKWTMDVFTTVAPNWIQAKESGSDNSRHFSKRKRKKMAESQTSDS